MRYKKLQLRSKGSRLLKTLVFACLVGLVLTLADAASQGGVHFMIGSLYYYGLMLPEDKGAALSWFEAAAAWGDEDAQNIVRAHDDAGQPFYDHEPGESMKGKASSESTE